MSEEMIKQSLEFVEKLLRDPTCEWTMERGTTRIDKGDSYRHFEPTDGQFTLTIKTRGGAQDTERREYIGAATRPGRIWRLSGNED